LDTGKPRERPKPGGKNKKKKKKKASTIGTKGKKENTTTRNRLKETSGKARERKKLTKKEGGKDGGTNYWERGEKDGRPGGGVSSFSKKWGEGKLGGLGVFARNQFFGQKRPWETQRTSGQKREIKVGTQEGTPEESTVEGTCRQGGQKVKKHTRGEKNGGQRPEILNKKRTRKKKRGGRFL